MKKKCLFIVAGWLLCVLSVMAEDRMTVAGVQYSTMSGSTASACLTVKAIGDVEIKERIRIKGKDYTVTEVGEAYFKKNDYPQSVSIPNSVNMIRKGAFKGCSNLSKITIPDQNCTIENGAFEGCTSVAYIKTHNMQKYSPEYILAYLDKNIPYYQVKDDIAGAMSEEVVDEILEDMEFDVDTDIPVSKKKNRNAFAYIIGNEDYSYGEAGVPNVEFAVNDAQTFAKYCESTLGVPKDNIHCYNNLSFGKMARAIRNLKETADANKDKKNSTIIFYYAGHGLPDEATKDAFLMPTDADGKVTEGCYSMARLYKELGALPVDKVYVFLDACFSGSQRGDGMLTAARGMALVAKEEKPQGNMVVFSAATGNQTAYPYKEKQHGMFTYYLLNQLRRYKGLCTVGELGEYVQRKVSQKSIMVNGKQQSPTISCSPNMPGDWKNMKLK